MTRPVLTLAARELAAAGWKVFPVHPVTKRPMTSHGHLDASNNPLVVGLAWQPYWMQGASIATPTGDGLLVIDVDPRNGGRIPAWAPPTRTVRTQSGGVHLHYAIDEDIKSRAGLFGPGVDSKSKGGYVLIPPSPGYAWESDQPRAGVTAAWLAQHYDPQVVVGRSTSARRLAPHEWRRGIIHDQVVAWAAWWAGELDSEGEVSDAVWMMVKRARDAGVEIDNARDHINTAIRWVWEREAAKSNLGGPSLG